MFEMLMAERFSISVEGTFVYCISGKLMFVLWWFDVYCPLVAVPVLVLIFFSPPSLHYLITDILNTFNHFFSLSLHIHLVYCLFYVVSTDLLGLRGPAWCLQPRAATVKSSPCWWRMEQKSMPKMNTALQWATVFFIQLLHLTWYKPHYFPLQALSVAVQQGRQEAVLKLLQLGADKTIKTKTGKCPADLAVIVKNAQVPFSWFCDSFRYGHSALSQKDSFYQPRLFVY